MVAATVQWFQTAAKNAISMTGSSPATVNRLFGFNPMKFSANLGFLFRELALTDAIRAAAQAGFLAVECHWPYDVDPADVRAVLRETGLPMLALNTGRGNATSDFGLSAVPGREIEARALIDRAVEYAAAVGAENIHVMSGRAAGPEARATLMENLRYADERIGTREIGLLVEPLNHRDAPGSFLRTLEDAAALVAELEMKRLKVMFDCYHQQIEGGDLLRRYQQHARVIGHIQIAGVPERGEPDAGEVAYDRLLRAIVEAGYTGWFGAEYRPQDGTLAGLGWLRRLTRPAG
jgi:hydroxypyruvate isomerase